MASDLTDRKDSDSGSIVCQYFWNDDNHLIPDQYDQLKQSSNHESRKGDDDGGSDGGGSGSCGGGTGIMRLIVAKHKGIR